MARRTQKQGVLIAGFDGVDQQMVNVDSTGAVSVTSSAASPTIVGGPAADDAAASGNPVPVGGIYTAGSPPTYTAGDRTQLQAGLRGSLNVQLRDADGTTTATVGSQVDGGASVGALYVIGRENRFNGTTWDRARGNQDVTVFSSAARTATPTPFDGVNYDGKSLHLVIDCTAITSSPSVVFTLQGKDAISGKFYTILASVAIVGTGTTILRVGPSLTAAANLVANDILPRSYRVIATHGNADSISYSVGMSIVNG